MKRLAPPYYVLLAFSLALYVLFHHKFNGEVFWFVTYMQNYYWMHTNYQTGLAYLGHTWYLSLDITLFAIYIYIYTWLRAKSVKTQICTFIALIAVSFVSRQTLISLNSQPFTMALSPLTYLDCFAIGSLIAVCRNFDRNAQMRVAYVFGILGAALLAVCIYTMASKRGISLYEAYQQFGNTKAYITGRVTSNVALSLALISAAVVIVLINAKRTPSGAVYNKLVEFGGYTYSLYLIHYPLLAPMHIFTHNAALHVVLSLAVTVVLALVWEKKISPKLSAYIH
jgi:peptidoglycan/LPS O-acetylase OafA/YrhL